MTSVFKDPGLNLSGFTNAEYIDLAANWFRNEFQRAMLMSNIGDEEAKAEGKKLVTLLGQLVTGNYVARYSDTMTHELLTKMLEGATFQRFIFDRVNLLGLVPEFNRAQGDKLLEQLFGTFSTPLGTNNPIFISAEPNIKALSIFFKENHWMLLLLFAIASYNLKSFDLQLYTN